MNGGFQVAIKETLTQTEQAFADSKARKFLPTLFDEGGFSETGKYTSKDGKLTSVITGFGKVNGSTVYAFAQDIAINSGAMSEASAAKLKKLYEAALKNGCPVVSVFDSKGGDVAEGQKMLNAYGEIAALSAKLSGVVPQIAVVSGICAGAAATLACMADFVIMTQDSELFMTSPFIADDGKLAGAGKAENAAKSGVASIVVKDTEEAIKTAADLLGRLPQNNLDCALYFAQDEYTKEISGTSKGMDFVKEIADEDSVLEVNAEFGTAALTAFARICDSDVGIVATDKVSEKLTGDDADKIARFVQICDAFSLPVVTVMDTAGFAPSMSAELAGSIRSTAMLVQTYAGATTQKICLIKGKALAQAYIALGSAAAGQDYVIAYEDAVISPLEPKAAAVFLYGNEGKTPPELDECAQEYALNEASAFNACAHGFADETTSPENVREAICSALSASQRKRVNNPAKKHINYVF